MYYLWPILNTDTFILNILDIRSNSDTLGIIASSLCLVHCIATPFLFLAHTGPALFEGGYSVWWKSLDFIFLGLSFIAIYRSTKTTISTRIKYAFWFAWLSLLLIVINEKLSIFYFPEEAIYVVSILLVGLHFYNKRNCHCKGEKCCVN
ncbi:MerC domain-containing protein [Aquimarina pacifica]|uniref:MerC domain-containing protein n=1 Tax=Aquimarina pacifica TaxID=1296415 RepID=UPI0009DEBF8F|nr:MerC domain-containing protein [Aquimarina pacifica]